MLGINRESAVLDILFEFEEVLPWDRYCSIADLAKAGEWGIAFEILCDNLSEAEVPIPGKTFDRMFILAGSLPHYGKCLARMKQLIKTD